LAGFQGLDRQIHGFPPGGHELLVELHAAALESLHAVDEVKEKDRDQNHPEVDLGLFEHLGPDGVGERQFALKDQLFFTFQALHGHPDGEMKTDRVERKSEFGK